MKLEQIAKLSGVSKSAASLALRGKPGVSEKTREKIIKIAQENRYTPLRKKRKKSQLSGRVRFVIPSDSSISSDTIETLPFFDSLTNELSRQFNQKNFAFIRVTFNKDNIVKKLLDLEKEDPSDGVVILGTNLSFYQISLLSNNIKNFTVIDTLASKVNCNAIIMNNYLGGFQAAQYLIDHGHKSIGYIIGTPRIDNFLDRSKGFKDCLQQNSFSLDSSDCFQLPSMKYGIIENKKLTQFIQFCSEHSAIFCEDDYIAISTIKTLTQQGFDLPNDLSIIGFDDINESQIVTPALTTVHVPIYEMAHETFKLVEENVVNCEPKLPKKIILNTTIAERSSVNRI